jgi:hypothetical protein
MEVFNVGCRIFMSVKFHIGRTWLWMKIAGEKNSLVEEYSLRWCVIF